MSFVFVTGASGFVGSHLVEALQQRGVRTRCLVRKNSTLNADVLTAAGVERVTGDLDDAAQLRRQVAGADVVYHVAGMTCALKYEELLRVNRDGVARIAEACAAQPSPPTLVIVSSIAAGGPAARGQIRTEADPPTPISQYGETKIAGEAMAKQRAADVPITIVRPGIVFGPRDRGMLPMFSAVKWLCMHPVPGYKQPPLSYIYAADLAEILIAAANRGARLPADGATAGQGIYYAVTREYPDLREWGRMMRPLLGRSFAPVVPIPPPIPWLAARLSQRLQQLRGKPDMFNTDKIREANVESWACSPAACERDLGFTPPQPLQPRLQETVDWYRRHKWL